MTLLKTKQKKVRTAPKCFALRIITCSYARSITEYRARAAHGYLEVDLTDSTKSESQSRSQKEKTAALPQRLSTNKLREGREAAVRVRGCKLIALARVPAAVFPLAKPD